VIFEEKKNAIILRQLEKWENYVKKNRSYQKIVLQANYF